MKPDLGGCIDIDECAIAKHTCTKNQFCVNTEGSYSCLECDKSCNSCTGDGPDLCTECTDGYELRNGHCKGNNVKICYYCLFILWFLCTHLIPLYIIN